MMEGNTARRFFADPELSLTITGIDKEIIHRFGTLLRAMSSGYPIITEVFESFAKETRRMYQQLYPWFYMPPSVHKILIHGATVIQYVLLPIGMLSEDAQEVRNKHLRKFRLGYSRKCSRQATMEDELHRLLITSDQLVTCIHLLQSTSKRSALPTEVRSLLHHRKMKISI